MNPSDTPFRIGRRLLYPLPVLTGLLLFLSAAITAPSARPPAPTTPESRFESFQQRQAMAEQSIFRGLSFRCVGPIVMSGRVTDIVPAPDDPYSFYVAYATGGLWKTRSSGTRFKPIFEGYNNIAIGAIAVDPNQPGTLWLGGGEGNSARSHYSGTGVYKTTDDGKTWTHMGLPDSHHISEIEINPHNPDIVFVAVQGHLYTSNRERGLFRTTDGGKTWDKVLFINPKTGVVDVVLDPQDPQIVYAASWEKWRRAWNIEENGKHSAIWKSTDGGDTWRRLKGGFPQHEYVGRIGLDVAPGNPNVIYALVDSQKPKPDEDQDEGERLSAHTIQQMTKDEILSLDDSEMESFLRKARFHSDYKAADIRKQLEAETLTVTDLMAYARKLNPLFFDPAFEGAQVWRSDDAGESWQKMNVEYLDSVYNIAGYYFGQIRVAPDNEDRIYVMGVPLLTSDDGGRTYHSLGAPNVHVDHHAMWIDPAHPKHIINGNDGGLNLTWDGGDSWIKLNYVPVGQFYTVNVDMAEPYNIYGGLQDNGTYKGSSRSVPLKSEPWERIGGGDGFYIEISPDGAVYTGSQYGYYNRRDKDGGYASVRPGVPRMDEPPLVCSWQTPILLSRHSPNVFYYGANRLFRSLDRGENLKPISPPLTSPTVRGNVPYGTISAFDESKQTFGVLYAGTDDGRVHVTRNGGYTWKESRKGLPRGIWCTRVEASHHKDGVAYVSFSAYRNDNFDAYLYRTDDFGKTWTSIRGNLPAESINVIREDPSNENILYVGTDSGVFVSLDRGEHWQVLQTGIPICPTHDLVIHPRDKDLVVGTHGRSIYVMDIEPIQELTTETQQKAIALFDLAPVREDRRWNRAPSSLSEPEDLTEIELVYWLGAGGDVVVKVIDEEKTVVRELEAQGYRGVNVLMWDGSVDRDTVLSKRLKKAEEEWEKASKKLAEATNPPPQDEADEKDSAPERQTNARTKRERESAEIRKLQFEELTAKTKVKDLQEIIDEPQTWAESTETVRNRMIRNIYVDAGKYTVEIQSGDTVSSTTLEIKGNEGGGSRRSREAWEKEKAWE